MPQTWRQEPDRAEPDLLLPRSNLDLNTLCLGDRETASHCPAVGAATQIERPCGTEWKTDLHFKQTHNLYEISLISMENEKHISEAHLGSCTTIKERKNASV